MKSQEGADNDLQLSLYHLGLLRRWPHIPANNIALSLYYVKHNEKITTARKQEDSTRVEERVLGTIREIEARMASNDFPPQPSALCDWCGYKAMCPAWKYLFSNKQTVVSSKEEIEKHIQEYFTLKKQALNTTKRL